MAKWHTVYGTSRALRCGMAFLIPFVLLTLICVIEGIAPFGDKTFLYNDMKRQYVDFISYYKSVFVTENNFFYSFSNGLGGNMMGMFAYYLTSPLLLFFLFVPESAFPAAITVMILVKLSLCGLTAHAFLYTRAKHPAVFFFSTAYAMSAYNALNATNSMWLDVVILFPLVYLFHIRMREGEKHAFLAFTLLLALSLFTNYYITYMVLLFLLLESIVFWRGGRAFLKFLGSCVLAGALTAFLLLPAFFELLKSAKNAFAYGQEATGVPLGPIDFLQRLRPLSFDSSQVFQGGPQLYASVTVTVLFVIFFFCRGIARWRRLRMMVLALVLALSMAVPRLDLIWHAFSPPEGYRYRYSFLLIFVMTTCAYEALVALGGHRRGFGARVVVSVAVVLIGMIHLADLSANMILVYRQSSMLQQTEREFLQQVHGDGEIIRRVQEEDAGFYRMEDLSPRAENDDLYYGYNGVTVYSSVTDMQERLFLQRLGSNDNALYAEYNPYNTSLYNRLLGVKYLLPQFGSVPDTVEHTIPMAVGVRHAIADVRAFSDVAEGTEDPFAFQEALLSVFAGEKCRVLQPAAVLHSETDEAGWTELTLQMAVSGDLYFYATALSPEADIGLMENGEAVPERFGNLSSTRVLRVGTYAAGEEEEISLGAPVSASELEHFLFVSEDTEELNRITQRIAEGAAEVSFQSSSAFTVTVPAGYRTLLLLIPYDDAWEIRADGERVLAERFGGCYTAVPIAGGDAKTLVTFRYIPRGWYAGCAVSICAVLVLLWLWLMEKERARAGVRAAGNVE